MAGNGATVRADSEYAENPGGPAVAARLIDGVIRRPASSPEANRWHSELSAAASALGMDSIRPAREDLQSYALVFRHRHPVDFAGQCMVDGGRSLQTLFRRENAQLDAAHPSITVEFPPVVTDNFRLLITRSSNKDLPKLHATERNPGLWPMGGPADRSDEAHAGPPTRRNARRAAARGTEGRVGRERSCAWFRPG